MLLGLYISNLAIAKKTELNFSNNLVIISGETGAGKTIIMNSLGIVCGTNANSDLIRNGQESATVEASFTLNDSKKALETLEKFSLYDGEDIVVISRTIAKSRGKSVVNGHITSVKELSEIGRTLVDMHGQHEIQSLLNPDTHLMFIDAFGGKETSELKVKVISEIARYKEIKKIKRGLEEFDRKYIEERDFINFEIAELEETNLRKNEEEELREEEKILSNLKEVVEIVNNAENLISLSEDYSLLKQMSTLIGFLSRGSQIAERLVPLTTQAENMQIELKEIARDLSSFSGSLVWEPDRLNIIEERLSVISKIKLKYKKKVDELIIYLSELKDKVKSFNSLKEQIDELQEEEGTILKEINRDVELLSTKRKETALIFSSLVIKQLKELAMENADFEVRFKTIEDNDGIEFDGKLVKLFSDGVDYAEFLIKTNPGDDCKPLASIASGGELSRTMLAIKYVIASIDEIPILAFDEVDAGIGGKTGEKVAEKLLEISKYRQVICITHLPQIASLPGEHFVVEKIIDGGETFLKVNKLGEYERINEIARMISGTGVTDTTIKQSKELLERWKQ